MCKVLIVEDNLSAIGYYKTVLKRLKHSADVAYHGKSALDLLEKKKYDIIIMDLEMPILDGVQTIKKIREKNRKVPVIIITAYSSEKRINEVIENGANDVFLKPLTMNKLESIISRYSIGKPVDYINHFVA